MSFERGDVIGAKFNDLATGRHVRLWITVEACDDEKYTLCGSVGSLPPVDSSLQLEQKVVVPYADILVLKALADCD